MRFNEASQIMRRIHDLSLRTKLIISSLVITLVPLMGIGYLTQRATRDALVQAANEALDGAAQQTATNLDEFIRANLDAVRTEAQLSAFGDFLSSSGTILQAQHKSRPAQIVAILEALSRRDQLYIRSYAVLDTHGIDLADTDVRGIGTALWGEDYFREPISSGLPYVSPVEFDPEDGPSLYFAAPVRDDHGIIVGVLRIRYDATILQQIVSSSKNLGSHDSSAVLLDENHLRLADSSMPGLDYKTVVPLDARRAAHLQAIGRLPVGMSQDLTTNLPGFERGLLNAPEEKFFSADLRPTGTSREAVAVAAMNSRPWMVAFAQTEVVFLAPVDREMRNVGVVVLGVVVLITLAAIAGARVVTNPVLQLTVFAQRIGDGDFSANAPVGGRDEIGRLAASFNAMAVQLQQTLDGLSRRSTELVQTNEQLQEEIAERQRSEEAVRAAEMRYRLLVERIPL